MPRACAHAAPAALTTATPRACAAGTTYKAHACGSGSDSWAATGGNYPVQWGPYTSNDYLYGGGHCSCCCNCNQVYIMCVGQGMTLLVNLGQNATLMRAENAKKRLALPLPQGHTSVSEYCANPKHEQRGPTGQGPDCLSSKVHIAADKPVYDADGGMDLDMA